MFKNLTWTILLISPFLIIQCGEDIGPDQNKIFELEISTNPEGAGEIQVLGETGTSWMIKEGEKVSIQAFPDYEEDWMFQGWEGDFTETDNPLELVIDSDTKLIAEFEELSSVYTGSSDHEVHKLDSNGGQIWIYDEHTEGIIDLAVNDNGFIYSASRNNKIHKIDSEGNQIWRYQEHDYEVTSIAVDTDGNVYSASRRTSPSDPGELHKIDESGNMVWIYDDFKGAVYSISVNNSGSIYVGTHSGSEPQVFEPGKLYKISETGDLVWIYGDHADAGVVAVATDSDGNIYTGSGTEIQKLDDEGNHLWSYTDHWGNLERIAVDREGHVYSSSWDEPNIHKVDPDGKHVWIYQNDSVFPGLAVGHNNNIYASSDNKVYKINPDGELIWEYNKHSNDGVEAVAVDPD